MGDYKIMGMKFDNTISLLDIVAIIGAMSSAMYSLFAIGAEVEKLRMEVSQQGKDIVRIETAGDKKDDELLQVIKEQRKEQKEQYNKLEEKFEFIRQELVRGR